MKLIYCLLLSFCFFYGKAQDAFKDSLKNQLVADWIRAKAYTLEYLQAMPADKYGFRPVDSMRSFAQQMLHLATGNAGLSSIGTGAKYPFVSFAIEKSASAQSKDSVTYYVSTSYDFVITGIRNLDANKLTDVVSFDLPGGKRTATRLVWLMKNLRTPDTSPRTVYDIPPYRRYTPS